MKNKLLLLLTFVLTMMLSCNQPQRIDVKEIVDSTKYLNKIDLEKQSNKGILNSNDLHLFTVSIAENEKSSRSFVSLSDIYNDSLAVPRRYVANQKSMSFNELAYFELEPQYRKRLLKGTNVKETDTMFLYDYSLNQLVKFQINKLKAVAQLSPYRSDGDVIYDGDYMIGFKVDKDVLEKSASNYYRDVLVYIGSQNPFIIGKLQLAKWEKINEKNFPKTLPKVELKNEKYRLGNHYQFKSDTITCFIQDILFEDSVVERRLIAVGAESDHMLIEKYFAEGEGTSLTPLNLIKDNGSSLDEGQWIGYLFKNKPPVVFNFETESFGCPSITFLNKMYADVPINCDNRH